MKQSTLDWKPPLLACPYCGSVAVSEQLKTYAIVKCERCPLQLKSSKYNETVLIEIWNRLPRFVSVREQTFFL